MKLKFLGNGSGFSDSHNGCFFTNDNDMYFIDCSLLNLNKMIDLNLSGYDNVHVIITHMHDDHVSGLGLLIQKLYYLSGKKIDIIASEKLMSDIVCDLTIKGVDSSMYTLSEEAALNNFTSILTSHTPQLEGKCFGYSFDLEDKHIVYTGDTNTLEPFYPYISEGSEVYVDMSAVYGVVHLKYNECCGQLEDISKVADVYLMHMDNEEAIKAQISGTNLKIAELYSEDERMR